MYYSGRFLVNAEIQALKIDIGILRTTILQDCKICPTQTILIHNLLREVDLLKKHQTKGLQTGTILVREVEDYCSW